MSDDEESSSTGTDTDTDADTDAGEHSSEDADGSGHPENRGSTDPDEDDWAELLEDEAEIAAEYREHGWEVTTLRPEDVTPAEGQGQVGFDVLVPDEEYETVESLLEEEGVTVDGAEVFSRVVDDTVYALAVELDEEDGTAVVIPMYYRPSAATDVVESALEDGELSLYVRPREGDRWVTFFHEDPSPFVPEDPDSEAS